MTFEEAAELLGPAECARLSALVDAMPPPTKAQTDLLVALFRPDPGDALRDTA